VLAVNADSASRAVHAAATTAHIYTIGWIADYSAAFPKTIIANVQINLPQILVAAATLVQSGTWQGKLYRYGLKEDVIQLTGLSAAQSEQIDALRKSLIEGKIRSLP